MSALVKMWPGLVWAAMLRASAYAAMIALALWAEARPAPTLPDVVLALVPYVSWVDRVNYVLWLVCFVPISLALLWLEPERWRRYMITGALLCLARGVCIAVTGLGAPDLAHCGPGVAGVDFFVAFVSLLSPVQIFGSSAMHIYLTKDLFFSGHTATTLLLLLYVWHRPRLRAMALVAHVLVVASVFAAHLHYTIDVIGAWAVTYALFCARERPPLAAFPGVSLIR